MIEQINYITRVTQANETTLAIAQIEKIEPIESREVVSVTYDIIEPIYETYTAGTNINSGRVCVVIDGIVYYANKNNVSHYGKVVGISKQSVLSGQHVQVYTKGTVPNLSLISDRIYYYTENGMLTTTPQTTGIWQSVGISTSTTNLLLNLSNPIIL